MSFPTIWITGASGAIGGALARRVVRRGGRVALTARRAQPLHELAGELGESAFVAEGDAVDPVAMRAVLRRAEEALGPVTGMAHCVGSIFIRSLHATREDDLHSVLAQNFMSAWHVLREFVGAALRHGMPSSAVLIGSVATRRGFPNHEAIASAKAAVAGLAQSAAATYADKGIRINCVHPGLTRSAMSSRLTANADAAGRLAQANPLGRLGDGDDTAALIDFLLDDASSWMTGQAIGVDGGQGFLQASAR